MDQSILVLLAGVVGLGQGSHGCLASLVCLEGLSKGDDGHIVPSLGSSPVLLQRPGPTCQGMAIISQSNNR